MESTISCIDLCSQGRAKSIVFVSSTAVLRYHSYSATTPIKEDDALSSSRTGLANGYGQTKYVSEFLLREAGKRGLRGAIIRAPYIGGTTTKGISPTDDFLLRLLKGSIQLGCAPDLGDNAINVVPVSHCAKTVVAAAFHLPSEEGVEVVQLSSHPLLPFKSFLGALERYHFSAPIVPYAAWKTKLEEYVASTKTSASGTVSDTGNLNPLISQYRFPHEPHALLPLFDWVTDNLPKDTESRVLDDSNARKVLEMDNPKYEFEEKSRVTQETVGLYLAYLVAIGFIEPPRDNLPRVDIEADQRKALEKVGRSGGK